MSAAANARAWLHGDIDADPRLLIKALLAEEEYSAPRDCPERNIAVGAQYFRGVPLQERVFPWLLECFGGTAAADVTERCDRFIEEAFELVQSLGYDAARIDALKAYTWGRPPGEPAQEAGGVMVTLAALCSATGLDMHEAGEVELTRILQPEIMERIRAKQAAKAREIPFSPLPATSIITCVYCGYAYPDHTPTHGHPALTEHIRTCEKHPLRKAELANTALRCALVGLVGADGEKELRTMRSVLEVLPGDAATRAVSVAAVDVLLATLEEAGP